MEPMADHSHQTPQHYSYQSQRDIRERSATTTAASAPCSGDEAPIANHANQKQPYRAPGECRFSKLPLHSLQTNAHQTSAHLHQKQN